MGSSSAARLSGRVVLFQVRSIDRVFQTLASRAHCADRDLAISNRIPARVQPGMANLQLTAAWIAGSQIKIAVQ